MNSMQYINYHCVCKAPEAWKEEMTALLCYLKAKTFAPTKRLDETPCMKDMRSPHVMENLPE